MDNRVTVLRAFDGIRKRHAFRSDANSRIAYGVAKGMGIDTRGMTPKEVWAAIADKGVSKETVYSGVSVNAENSKNKLSDLQKEADLYREQWLYMQKKMAKISSIPIDDDGYGSAVLDADNAKSQFIGTLKRLREMKREHLEQYPDLEDEIMRIGSECDAEYDNENDVLTVEEEIEGQKSVIAMYDDLISSKENEISVYNDMSNKPGVSDDDLEELEQYKSNADKELKSLLDKKNIAQKKLDFMIESSEEIHKFEVTHDKSAAEDVVDRMYSYGEVVPYSDFIDVGKSIINEAKDGPAYKEIRGIEEKSLEIGKQMGKLRSDLKAAKDKIGISYFPGKYDIAESKKLTEEEKIYYMSVRSDYSELEKKRLKLEGLTNKKEIEYKRDLVSRIMDVRGEGTGFKKGIDESVIKKHFRGAKKSKPRKCIEEAYSRFPESMVARSLEYGDIFVETAGRAFYERLSHTLAVDSSGANGSVHELGHRYEDVYPEILQAEIEFYKHRTDGESLELIGGGCKKSEKCRKDKFFSRYCGKDPYMYGGKISNLEIFSMGIANLLSDDESIHMDDEYCCFIVGLLATVGRKK